jgi:hypothetical protein
MPNDGCILLGLCIGVFNVIGIRGTVSIDLLMLLIIIMGLDTAAGAVVMLIGVNDGN